MKLSKDRASIQVNESLTLAGMPSEAFHYKLGSKSALEWVIYQYQVKGDSDPNREEDPGYIVRLVGQVVRVSVETVRIAARRTLASRRARTIWIGTTMTISSMGHQCAVMRDRPISRKGLAT